MKKRGILILLVALMVFCSAGLYGCSRDQRSEDIVILFTNDVHCGIDDDIGYAGLAAYKKSMEAQCRYVALVDCGDFSQGSYVGAVSKGSCLIRIMNAIGYDFATFGNHEFDFGMDVLRENIALSDAQLLNCNISYTGSGVNALAAVKPYEVVNYGGVKVGFLGVTTPTTTAISTPTYFMENGEYVYDFLRGDPQAFAAAVQAAIDGCRAEGADYVVAITHLGQDEVDHPFTSADLIAATSGIDVLLDAHSHSDVPCRVLTDRDGNTVYTAQTGTKLANFGQLVITREGLISLAQISDYTMKDPETEALIKSLTEEYAAAFSTVVAHSDVTLSCFDADGVRMVRNREVGVGNLVADAYQAVCNANIGMINGGGVRSDLPAGDITYQQLINVQPYGNALCSVKITGAELLDMLEYFYRAVGPEYRDGKEAIGEFGSFQQVSGIRFVVNTDIPSSVEVDSEDSLLRVTGARRVSDVEIIQDGAYVPLDSDRVYVLASTNYMIKNGGCGMGVFLADHELVINESIPDYQALIDYITSLNGDLSRYTAPENRIRIR